MRLAALALAAAILAAPAFAGPEDFSPGPVIMGYGPVTDVPDAPALPEGTVMKVAFDVADAAEPGKINRNMESAARFLNLNARAGVAPENMSVAIIVHGGASADLVARDDNATAPLIAELVKAGASIQLCGQTAAYRGIAADDLLPGVTLNPSAMTAHALLQQRGYTLNPF